jgi:radical SAM superfamily enzyme YgiQ (UPF0313 family)
MLAVPQPARQTRLLLVNPRFPESFWSFRWALDEVLPGKRAVNPPLGLATLAALCPEHWTVEIVDENIEPVPRQPRADIIGVCGMGVQHARQAELLAYYRKRGYFVVAGGSYASLCPERYAALADAVIAGESEYIWPRFCADFERGAPQALYRETGVVSLADSPVPRFDLLKLDRYTTATLQFSRGCPFLCEFCDIIVMFGRKPRYKTLDQVGRELDALRARNVHSVFFVDDNLIGNKAVAKELLRFLRRYQAQHDYRFDFGTEASLNMAQDRELLELFRAARFTWVFIGIESPDAEALRHTRKTQNTHEDILTSVRRIYSHGIDVFAGFIVGFDSDTPATFERQYQFIRASGIQVAMVGLLTALPRTPLHERLRREGRLIEDAESSDNTKVGTNVLPKRMRYEEMVSGYVALYRRLLSDRAIADRVRNKLRHLRHPAYRGEYAAADKPRIVARLLVKGILRGGWSRLYHFVRSLPWLQPGKLPLAIMDWIGAIAMRNYADRHLAPPRPRDAALAGRWFASFERAIIGYLRDGRAAAELSLLGGTSPQVKIRFTCGLDRAFFQRCLPRLVRLLRRSRASLMLVVEEIEIQQVHNLQRMLRGLARYGDRISIEISDRVRELVAVDSSRFHLVLERSRGR